MFLFESSIKRKFFEILKTISERAGELFSGIGLLLYDTHKFYKKYYTDLRPSFSCPKHLLLGRKKTLECLLDISKKLNLFHDGFIFFNENGLLTHVSQYFAPLPIGNIIPNENYGTRYRTAQYGSLLKGIILTGIVSSDRNYFMFYKGLNIKSEYEIKYNQIKLKAKI